MKTKIGKFGAGLMALALALVGAGAYADDAERALLPEGIRETAVKVADGFYQDGTTYGGSSNFFITSKEGLKYLSDFVNRVRTDYSDGPSFNYTQNAFSGKTVHLQTDLDLAGYSLDAIGYDPDKTFYGSFNGEGHTISNLSIVNELITTGKKYYAGLFGYVTSVGTVFENLTLDNVTIKNATNYAGALMGRACKATQIVRNVHVTGTLSVSATSFIGGLIGHNAAQLANCSVNATGSIGPKGWCGGLVGYVAENSATVIDACSVKGGVVITTTSTAGGLTAHVGAQNVIKNCDVTAKVSGSRVGAVAGWKEGATGGAQIVNNDSKGAVDGEDQPIARQLGATDETTVATVVGTGVSFDANGQVVAGIFESLPDALLAEGYMKKALGTTPETWEVCPLPPVAQIGETTYTSLEAAFTAVKARETVKLLCDLDFTDRTWTPVNLVGSFDGQNHTISNLKIDLPEQDNVGFFSKFRDQEGAKKTIRNLTLENVNVKGRSNVAALVGGNSEGAISNVTVRGSIKVEGATAGVSRAYTGVVVGGWGYMTFIDVTVDGLDKAASYVKGGGTDGRYVGGLVGHADDVRLFENCTVKNLRVAGDWLTGGMCGPGPADGVCRNCTVENVDIAGNYSGGVFGWFFDNSGARDAQGVMDGIVVRNVTFERPSSCGAVGGYSMDNNVVVKNLTVEGIDEKNLIHYVAYVTVGSDNYFYSTIRLAIDNAETLEAITVTDQTATVPADYRLYEKGDLWGVEAIPFVAQINDAQKYMTLGEAIAAAKAGDAIKLLLPSAEDAVLPTGATFSKNGQDYTGTLSAPDGSILKDNGDGTYAALTAVAQIGETKFASLAEALAAVQNGETVKVLKSGNVVTDYATQLGETGYGEGAGQNRLVIDTDAKFTLDLNGNTLTGRINFTRGDMTVANGTVRAATQALNLYGTKAYTESPYATLTLAANATVKANYGFGIFGGDPSNTMWPLGFGETLNVYGKVFAPSPIFVSGNVGMDTYADNIGTKSEIEALVAEKEMSVSAMMLAYGPKINIYDGAELGASLEGGDEDSPQGISVQGAVTVNVFGGTITGAEAVGVKGGVLNVSGGTLVGVGPKVNPIVAISSGTESSGAGIAVSTSYNGNYPIAVNVTGGTIKSANNAALLVAHSYSGATPCAAVKGVKVAVSGGTFIGGKDQSAILVEEPLAGEGALFPTAFITPALDADGNETGYPLCSSRIPLDCIAVGYVEKDNQNGTWTVTAGSPEIHVVETEFTPTYEKTEDVTDEEAQAAANEVKESLQQTLKDPAVSDLVGTGVNESTKDGSGNLAAKVVEALQAAAPADQKDQITSESQTQSYVEIKLDDIKVSVSATQEEGQAKVIEKTLTKVVYEVKPIVTTVTVKDNVETRVTTVIPNDVILEKPISFRLWLEDCFVSEGVEVVHKNANGDVIDTQEQLVKTEGGKRYVELTWNRFSTAEMTATSFEGKACLANGKAYETVEEALADELPADATIELLDDCDETDLALQEGQTIDRRSFAFTGTLAPVAGTEMVKAKDGTVYRAPEKRDVTVDAAGNVMPLRGFNFADTDVAAGTKEEQAAYLAAAGATDMPRWQEYALFGNAGTRVKLIPEIVPAEAGFSKVVIRAANGFTLSSPTRSGVKVSFQLLKRDGATGNFAEVGVPGATPSFVVDVTEIGPQTYWKIQTVFACEEEEP